MSASRASADAYIGVGTPVTAQVTRLPMASALRATWVSTWPRVHPAHSESAAWSPSRIPYAVSNRAAVAAATSAHEVSVVMA